MGCGESKDFDPSRLSNIALDPEEESLHLAAWQDAATRTRVLRGDSRNGDGEYYDSPEASGRKALEYYSTLMRREGGAIDEAVEDEGQQTRSSVPKAAVHNGSGSQNAAGHAPKDSGKDLDEAVVQEHLAIDPGCWKSLAEQGAFQRAEDMLQAAVTAEARVVGRTPRLAACLHALGMLYDARSNVDATGQQRRLSLTAATYARRALEVWDEVEEGRPGEHTASLASSLLLRGRSLCNFAIDSHGGPPDPDAAQDGVEWLREDEALDAAEEALKRALRLREQRGKEGLAEAVMAIGYLNYCRAGFLTRIGRAGPDGAALVPFYEAALSFYDRSLDLYWLRGPQAHADSVRMMCNIALVHSTVSRQGPAARRRASLEAAVDWYRQALALQEKSFGPKHQRTARIRRDMVDAIDRLDALPAPATNGGGGGGGGGL